MQIRNAVARDDIRIIHEVYFFKGKGGGHEKFWF